MSKQKKNPLLTALKYTAPLAAAGLSYKYLRTAKKTPFGKPFKDATWVNWFAGQANKTKTIKSKIKKIKDYGPGKPDIKMVDPYDIPKAVKNVKRKGVIIKDFEGTVARREPHGAYKLKGDLNVNEDYKVVDNILQNKLTFSKLDSKYIAKAQPLSKVIPDTPSFSKFINTIKITKSTDYIKPNKDWAMQKPHLDLKGVKKEMAKIQKMDLSKPSKKTNAIDQTYGLKKTTVSKIKEIHKKRKTYISQENLNVSKLVPEKRVQFLAHEGKVVPMTSHRRWWKPKSGLGDPTNRLHREGIKGVKDIFARNKQLQKGTYLLGADVIKTKGGGAKIVEIQHESGFFHNPRFLNKLNRTLLGKDIKSVAVGKSLAAGTGTAGVGLAVT